MDEFERREIILEHYQNPKNYEKVEDERYIKINANNESCIDNLDLYLLIENNQIKDIKFQGEACAISTSSTSIMITNLIGKTIEEAIGYIKNFMAMVNEEKYQEDLLKEGIVFNEIYKQNNRKACALLPYRDLLNTLIEIQKKNA